MRILFRRKQDATRHATTKRQLSCLHFYANESWHSRLLLSRQSVSV